MASLGTYWISWKVEALSIRSQISSASATGSHCAKAAFNHMSTTTQRSSRIHHGYCIEVSRRSTQATVSKGLAQGPYIVARAGVEPTTSVESHRLNQFAT